MTGTEALEAVAAGICGTDPCQNKCATCLRDAERALKALKLSWDQAAALMSGEAEVAAKRVASLGRYWFEHGAAASEKERRSTSDQIAEYLSDPRSEIDAASEKETP